MVLKIDDMNLRIFTNVGLTSCYIDRLNAHCIKELGLVA